MKTKILKLATIGIIFNPIIHVISCGEETKWIVDKEISNEEKAKAMTTKVLSFQDEDIYEIVNIDNIESYNWNDINYDLNKKMHQNLQLIIDGETKYVDEKMSNDDERIINESIYKIKVSNKVYEFAEDKFVVNETNEYFKANWLSETELINNVSNGYDFIFSGNEDMIHNDAGNINTGKLFWKSEQKRVSDAISFKSIVRVDKGTKSSVNSSYNLSFAKLSLDSKILVAQSYSNVDRINYSVQSLIIDFENNYFYFKDFEDNEFFDDASSTAAPSIKDELMNKFNELTKGETYYDGESNLSLSDPKDISKSVSKILGKIYKWNRNDMIKKVISSAK